MTDTSAVDDRELLRTVLQGLSRQVAGGSGESLASTQAFQTPIDGPDVPDAPMPDPSAPESDPAQVEHANAKRASASSSGYAWGGYENGRIPPKALKAIGQGSHKLEATAADAWIAMRAAAAKDGVKLSLTDSYRSYDQQVAVRKNKGHLVATATPGTSVHGWGRAVDANVKDPATLRWLQTNGAKFGWVNPAWAQTSGKNHEPWHWEFTGGGSDG